MPAADVNGTTLNYVTVGAGPMALVLHGGLGVDHTFYRALDPLASRLQLVYYDHRGNGRSGRPSRDTLTMDQWADDAVELAARLGAGDRFVAIGHSYGGFIAQELAIRHPDHLDAVILLNTTPGQLGEGEAPAPEGPPVPPEFAALAASVPETDEQLGESFRALFGAYLHRAPVEQALPLLEGTVFDAAAMVRGFEVLASWSSVDRLAEVDVPVLAVVGRHDAFTAFPQTHRIASRLPDAEVVILEESGHFPWIDQPEEFFATVMDWLDRRSISSA